MATTRISTGRTLLGALAVATLTALGASGAAAQQQATTGDQTIQQSMQAWNQDRYIQMQQAVAAHENCRAPLSESAMRAATRHIESQTGEPASPGRKLAIMDDAKYDMKEFVARNGCFNDRVRAALSQFDDQIAPAIHGQTATR